MSIHDSSLLEALRRATALVVDDQSLYLKIVSQALQEAGCVQVTVEDDPRQVMHWCSVIRFDLVILDLSMPHMDGYEVLRLLRTLPAYETVPVLMLTSHHDEEVNALNAGADDFVTKPFNPNILVNRAARMVRTWQLNRTIRQQNVMLDERVREIEDTRLEILRRLMHVAEFRDNETCGHVLRAGHHARMLAEELGYSESDIERLFLAACMHDIGKISIPDYILFKRGALGNAEWEIMRDHTVRGARLLECPGSKELQDAASIALHHHERWDGSGYPHGLKQTQSPRLARIAAVADVFDATLSNVPYRPGWDMDRSVEHIRSGAGSLFDPEICQAFDRCLDRFLAMRPSLCEEPGEHLFAPIHANTLQA